jgi:hypothetical protein
MVLRQAFPRRQLAVTEPSRWWVTVSLTEVTFLPADPEPSDHLHLRRPAGRGVSTDWTAAQPACNRDVPPGEGAAFADERLRARHELWIGGECGTRSCGIAKVTAGWPAGEMEGDAADERHRESAPRGTVKGRGCRGLCTPPHAYEPYEAPRAAARWRFQIDVTPRSAEHEAAAVVATQSCDKE